ncbi:MAG TPA: hypothetical protein PKY47_06970 [Acetomicrobium sp.]|uniref:hypothetical protein n=1 Tax=Acetomicrobium mobile TaxID=97477 RepID=UPI0026EF29F6|nr:hypothetical protein [Acetomicrobium mobile]HOB10290.1 hypothetical protein [Acetomicrobium sp.]HQA37091.1 hypothetical protein [Acetomicrobium sp.]HXK98615.1 hypothetical protein [Acetomicrobium sp.]
MFKFDESIETSFPGVKMGFLIMCGVSSSHPHEEREVREAIAGLRKKYGQLDRKELKKLNPIQAYVAYYKRFGYSYHVLAQLESVLQGKKSLHTESGLLQAMLFSELESMLLTAGHDLAQLHLPLQLKVATGAEVYQSVSGKEVSTVSGDMMLCDCSATISSILRGPDYKSRIMLSTSDVLFSIYAPPGIDENYIKTDLQKLEKRIIALSQSSKTELLHVFST